MNQFLTPPTSAALRCERKQPGLLGMGHQRFAGESAMSLYMPPPLSSIAGDYATDDHTAALIIVSQLSSPDEELDADEAERLALLLRELLQNLQCAKGMSVEALAALQAAAEAIPGIGPLMFSPGNLPGTIASAAGAVLAATQSKKITDLLDLTPGQKKALRNWASRRYSASGRKAGKTFRGKITIQKINGKLYLKIPLTLDAAHYKILGNIGKSHVTIPVNGIQRKLSSRMHLHADGARGSLKFITGNSVGFALAVGPQAYLDWTSSNSRDEFIKKSAASQPTNIASFLAGTGVGIVLGIAGAPLTLVLIVGLIAGAATQYTMSETGADRKLEATLKDKFIE